MSAQKQIKELEVQITKIKTTKRVSENTDAVIDGLRQQAEDFRRRLQLAEEAREQLQE